MIKLNKSYTKKALALSICLFVLWGILGAGASIAWFTDTDEVQKNRFYFGDMELEVSHMLEDGSFEKVTAETRIFDDHALYEPGYTQVVYLKVKNKGDVPFDYRLAVDVNDVTIGTNIFGGRLYLPDYLKFGVEFSDDLDGLIRGVVADRVHAQGIARIDFPAEPVNNGAQYPLNTYSRIDEPALQPGAERYIALIVCMPESVGNEANYRGDVVPTVEMGITVAASQEGTLN